MFQARCSRYSFQFSLSISKSDLLFTGVTESVNRLGSARKAFDLAFSSYENAITVLDHAKQQLVNAFVELRDISQQPELFFHHLLAENPEVPIDHNLVSYYATLFGWDSSLNFSEVASAVTLQSWSKDNQVPSSPQAGNSGLSIEDKDELRQQDEPPVATKSPAFTAEDGMAPDEAPVLSSRSGANESRSGSADELKGLFASAAE